MTINRSIIEDMELKSGTQIYVQSSMQGRVTISVDGDVTNVSFTLTKHEAEKFQEILDKVMNELEV